MVLRTDGTVNDSGSDLLDPSSDHPDDQGFLADQLPHRVLDMVCELVFGQLVQSGFPMFQTGRSWTLALIPKPRK